MQTSKNVTYKIERHINSQSNMNKPVVFDLQFRKFHSQMNQLKLDRG